MKTTRTPSPPEATTPPFPALYTRKGSADDYVVLFTSEHCGAVVHADPNNSAHVGAHDTDWPSCFSRSLWAPCKDSIVLSP